MAGGNPRGCPPSWWARSEQESVDGRRVTPSHTVYRHSDGGPSRKLYSYPSVWGGMPHCGHDPWVLNMVNGPLLGKFGNQPLVGHLAKQPYAFTSSRHSLNTLTLWSNNYSQGTRQGWTWSDGAASMGQPRAVPGALSHHLMHTIFQGLVQGRCSFIVRFPDSRLLGWFYIIFPFQGIKWHHTHHIQVSAFLVIGFLCTTVGCFSGGQGYIVGNSPC